MGSKIKMFWFALVSIMMFTAGSYGQNLGSLSAVRDVVSGGRVSEQVFDLTISLHRSWNEIASNPTLKNQYEEVIGYWADGVYEMTNGGHKLGRIRVFTNSRFFSDADIQWVANDPNGVRAAINGFIQPSSPGWRTYMADNFGRYSIPGNNGQLEDAGYALAHEMGHYIYSLFDEYVGSYNEYYLPQPDDKPVEPSIMNMQWNARGGNYQWLNFSTSNNIGNSPETAQGRVHGADAWAVLTRSPDLDSIKFIRDFGRRTQYPVLNGRAPSGHPWMQIELPSSRARDSLQIIWMSDTIVIDLVLDQSGSMMGTPIQELKDAAKAFVDVIDVYSKQFGLVPSLGITMFSTSVGYSHPITVLNNNSVRQIKDIIDTIDAYGATAMYDATLASLDKLISHSQINSNRLTMLFTDGENNNSNNNASSVISKSAANNIPIYTFGYGSGDYHRHCIELSNGTSGQFFANLTGSGNVNDAWSRIFGDMADLQYVANTTFSASNGLDFTIDPTVQSGIVEIRYTLNDSTNSSATFTVTDKNGILVSTTTTTIPLGSSYPQEQITLIGISDTAIAKANLGQWKVNVNSVGLTSTDLKGKIRIEGKSDAAYTAAIGNHQNGFYEWPQPLLLSASSSGKGGLITGLNVTATLTTPSGNIINITLNDGGVDGDRLANDGIYSLDYSNYTENGQYMLSVQFDNLLGNAYYTMKGVAGSITPVDTVFVTEKFVRTRSAVFHVTGVNTSEPTRTGSIMGFESDTLWSIIHSSGTLSSNTYRTEGKASLQISGNGWQQIKSQDINTDELRNVTNKLYVDLFMGNTQTNPYWTGQIQLYINCPSANVYNQYIGHVDLTGLELDKFSSLSFTLPQDALDILNGSYSDFSFSLSINTNANTGAYYFDNMRFEN